MKPIRSAEPKRHPLRNPGFDADVLIAAARQGVREALARHKTLGNSVVTWRNGRVVILQPEEIEI